MVERRRSSEAGNPVSTTSRPRRFQDMNDTQLEEELRIDPNDLKQVVCDHPELLNVVADRLAMLVSQRDEAKQILKEVEANVDVEIRHDAEVGGDKITEKAVESQKMIHPKVTAARNKLFELEKKCGKMSALKEAFVARRYAISDLVQLYLSNYYSGNLDRSNREIRHTTADTARQRQSEHFRNR